MPDDSPEIIIDPGPRPKLEDPATERVIDACFNKMNAVYKQYQFTPQEWAEMVKLSPQSTKRICDIERLALKDLTVADLKEYYDLHVNLWKSAHARANSLTSRLRSEVLGSK